MSRSADLPGGRRIANMPGTFTAEFDVPNVALVPTPRSVSDHFDVMGIDRSTLKVYRLLPHDLSVLVSREPNGKGGSLLWHLSISHPDRHPTWDEIKFARYKLLPDDVAFAMLLPPQKWYVNVPEQDHVFHLWEVHDENAPWESG